MTNTVCGLPIGNIHVDLPDDEFKVTELPMSQTAVKMATEYERKFLEFGIAHKAAIIYVVRWTHVENGNIWCTDSLFFDNKEDAMTAAKEHQTSFTEHDMRTLLKMSDHEFMELVLSNPQDKNGDLAWAYRRRLKQKTMYLPLKKKWFDMIASGEKKEEYREIKAKYIEQFCEQLQMSEPNHGNDFTIGFHLHWPEHYDKVVFTLGYPKKGIAERRLEFVNPKVEIREGKPEWGAEPGKKYFVITWEGEDGRT